MKILIVTQYFWPENFKINDLALGLKERDHEVTVLTGKPNYPDGKYYNGYGFFKKRCEFYNGIQIIRSPLIARGNGNGLRLFLNYISFALFGSLTSVLRLKRDNDFIFVFGLSPISLGIPAIVYKVFSKAPLFYWVQDLWPESLTAAGNIHSKFLLRLVEHLVKYIYKKSDIILISSKSFRKSVMDKGVQNEKIVYLPNWAEDIYHVKVGKDNDISKLFPTRGFNILFAGNVGDAQDFDSILKAVELTSNDESIHWIIVGEGRKKIWIEQEKKRRGLHNLHLLGKFPMNKMPYFFKESDVLLVSLKDESIFTLTVPAKIQSYLACGKPILAMLNGAGADIILESKSGFAVGAGDYNMLAEKVYELKRMSAKKLELMSKSGKHFYSQNFNRNVLIDSVVNLMESKKTLIS